MSIPALNQAFDFIDRLADLTMREAAIPGMTIAVTNRDGILKQFAYGLSDVGSRAAVTPRTAFEIGSLGKPFTVIALLQLVDAGELDLHAPVTRYLPWFKVRSAYEPVTVHHLLNHTSGLVRGTDIAPHGLYESWALRDLEVVCAPGDYFWYSNIGYKTLGFLLESLYGESLSTIVESRVLKPLGMNHTHAVTTADSRVVSATGYTSLYDDRPEHVSHPLVPAIWSEYATGDGAQISTAADMAAYLRLLLNRGRAPDGQLISQESFDMMARGGVWTGGDYYGYGLATYDVNGCTYIGHGGGNSGFRSAIVVDTEAGLGVVLLANRMGETDPLVEVAQQALTAVREDTAGAALSPLPQPADAIGLPDAASCVGTYRSAKRSFQITTADRGLRMRYEGQELALERRAPDSFYVPHPDFELALLEFGREANRVVEAFHGSDWYTNELYSGPSRVRYPKHWDAFCGHYRARNPELPNFRVVVRKGKLVFLNPWGNSEPLVALGRNIFRVGEDPRIPETIRFRAILDGQALRADYSGCPYYRTFTP
jgi:D-alanyl-D-alanine carboxypeptidase